MKKSIMFLMFCCSASLYSQVMTNSLLKELIKKQADSVYVMEANYCEFTKNNKKIIYVSDSVSNRMRFISPIAKVETLSMDHVIASLSANFHSALDVKYAVSNGVIWSVYIHPLKELFSKQVVNAIVQVYNANVTFGSTYQSTDLFFGQSAKPIISTGAHKSVGKEKI